MPAERIQRRRTKGWRMPENAVYVGRPSSWGNPYRVVIGPGDGFGVVYDDVHVSYRLPGTYETRRDAATAAVALYRLKLRDASNPRFDLLAGRDLVCWCPLSGPCHADVLLEIASGVTADA